MNTDEEESESSLFCAKNFIEKKFVLFYTPEFDTLQKPKGS